MKLPRRDSESEEAASVPPFFSTFFIFATIFEDKTGPTTPEN